MGYATLHGLAESSSKNLKTYINTHVKFCNKYKLEMFPADVLQMRRYIVHLAETHDSIDSMKNYVSGVRSLHLLLGFQAPQSDHYLYKKTVDGIKRQKNHVVKQAKGMTPGLLAQMSHFVDKSDLRQVVAFTTILSGFHLLFWKSNLVPDSSVKFDPTKQLARRNFFRLPHCYIARVYWSKTLQFHEKALDIPLVPNIDKRICPVHWLDYIFSTIPGRQSSPAFTYVNKIGELVALNYSQLIDWMRTWVTLAGERASDYTSHSLRRGGAQWAAQSGIQPHIIKLLGDWKSEAYLRYLDMSLQSRYDAMIQFTMTMS